MPDYNELKKMPIDRLIVYYQSLSAICDRYAKERDQYFNPTTPLDRNKWTTMNNLLVEVKTYYDLVFNALKERAMNDLDCYKSNTESAVKKTEQKKPVVKRPCRPKKTDKK